MFNDKTVQFRERVEHFTVDDKIIKIVNTIQYKDKYDTYWKNLPKHVVVTKLRNEEELKNIYDLDWS